MAGIRKAGLLYALLLAAPLAVAQQSSGQVDRAATITAEFRHAVNSRDAKAGDAVELEASYAVLSHGAVVIPAGSKLTGTVVEARHWDPRSKQRSRLVIRVQRAEWKGNSVALNAYIRRFILVKYRVAKTGLDQPCAVVRKGECVPSRDPRLVYTFSSPAVRDVRILGLSPPAGGTVLVSDKRDVELKKGTIVELKNADEGR